MEMDSVLDNDEANMILKNKKLLEFYEINNIIFMLY